MPAASIHPSLTTGHGLHPPTLTVGGSNNVFINGQPALRVDDATILHARPTPSPDPHASVISSGSSSVFINGKPAARIGSDIACGGVLSGPASSNVFIGG